MYLFRAETKMYMSDGLYDPAWRRGPEERVRPTVLLHACCGPCATSCVERLINDYSVTLFYYNPNITDVEEYLARREGLLKFIKAFNAEHEPASRVGYIEGAYEPELFLRAARDMENEPEGGSRCTMCFTSRLYGTAAMAKRIGADLFSTTMTVSPHKNHEVIAGAGRKIAEITGTNYLDEDFKKNDGFRRSTELSKEYGLYRQNYCGCRFSMR